MFPFPDDTGGRFCATPAAFFFLLLLFVVCLAAAAAHVYVVIIIPCGHPQQTHPTVAKFVWQHVSPWRISIHLSIATIYSSREILSLMITFRFVMNESRVTSSSVNLPTQTWHPPAQNPKKQFHDGVRELVKQNVKQENRRIWHIQTSLLFSSSCFFFGYAMNETFFYFFQRGADIGGSSG